MSRKILIPVGGGKGGVGKSFVSANLGIALAGRGRSTVLMDADLGAANLHTLLGISYPTFTLRDFLSGKVNTLRETLLTIPNSSGKLISGASEILALQSPSYKQKQKIYRGIKDLDCEAILLDLAAGTNSEVVDFFSLSGDGVVVIDPLPTSLENAYSFLKNCIYRRLLILFKELPQVQEFIRDASDPRSKLFYPTIHELLDALKKLHHDSAEKMQKSLLGFKPFIILNRVRDKEDLEVASRFQKVIDKFLGLKLRPLGQIPEHPEVAQSVGRRTPLVLDRPSNPASKAIQQICDRLELLWKPNRISFAGTNS